MKKWKKKAHRLASAVYYRKVYVGTVFGRLAYLVAPRHMRLTKISRRNILRMWERMA